VATSRGYRRRLRLTYREVLADATGAIAVRAMQYIVRCGKEVGLAVARVSEWQGMVEGIE
jgi:hypothetical protein